MSRRFACIILVLAIAVAVGFYVLGFGNEDRTEFIQEGHFKTLNAADTPPARAEEIYQSILPDMVKGYGTSGYPNAGGFQLWQRFNTAPYRSKTHGERFVNNYGNERAAAYQQVKKGTPLPPGAIVAKDSFAITNDGDVYAQSLFLMEKLPKGASKVTGDWRYVMITPSGEIYGDTNGINPEKVDFCHKCHQAVSGSDYLFYIPKAYRAAR